MIFSQKIMDHIDKGIMSKMLNISLKLNFYKKS